MNGRAASVTGTRCCTRRDLVGLTLATPWMAAAGEASAATPRWTTEPPVVLAAAHVTLELHRHPLPQGPAPPGGALAADGGRLVVASAEGRFIGVDLGSGEVTQEVLPSLDLGAAAMRRSSFIRLQEVPPRVHDLLLLPDRTAYITFNRYDAAEDRVRFHLARWRQAQAGWETVWRTPPLDTPMHVMGNGGRMALEPGGRRLFFSVGDHSLDRINRLPSDLAPQRPELPWGKVMVMDLAAPRPLPSVHSLGHRNIQGLAFLADGRLLASEHGPQGGDELNVIQAGRNYGWPWRSHGTHYGSQREYREGLGTPPPGPFEEPLHAFVPSIAPTQLVQLQGFHPRWDGHVVLGSLKAMTLFHILLAGQRVVYVEPIPLGHRIRDLRQVGNRLVMLADDGSLLIMSARR